MDAECNDVILINVRAGGYGSVGIPPPPWGRCDQGEVSREKVTASLRPRRGRYAEAVCGVRGMRAVTCTDSNIFKANAIPVVR